MTTARPPLRSLVLAGMVALAGVIGLAGCGTRPDTNGSADFGDTTVEIVTTIAGPTTTAAPEATPVDQAAVDAFLAGHPGPNMPSGVGPTSLSGGSNGGGYVSSTPPPAPGPAQPFFTPPTLIVTATCLTDGRTGIRYVVTASGGETWAYGSISAPGGVVDSGDYVTPTEPPPPSPGPYNRAMQYSASITVNATIGPLSATVNGSTMISCTFIE